MERPVSFGSHAYRAVPLCDLGGTVKDGGRLGGKASACKQPHNTSQYIQGRRAI
jgi:hypothetical protein